MSRVLSALHETACSECGRSDVVTVGSPDVALCGDCWEDRQRLTPEQVLLLLEGLSPEIACPLCEAKVRRRG